MGAISGVRERRLERSGYGFTAIRFSDPLVAAEYARRLREYRSVVLGDDHTAWLVTRDAAVRLSAMGYEMGYVPSATEGDPGHLDEGLGPAEAAKIATAVPQEVLSRIAREHLGVRTLETRNVDRLDFHEVSVRQLSVALAAAYREGAAQGTSSRLRPGETGTTASGDTSSAARTLVDVLGEETAAAVAGKCQVVYTKKQADLESARLADAIIETIGVERYRSLDVL